MTYVKSQMTCFFLFFFEFTFEYPIKYNVNISKLYEKSSLLFFWDPWCHHCSNFKPIWANLKQNSSFLHNISFFDYNRNTYRNLTNIFGTETFPDLIFYDKKANNYVRYNGVNSFDDIESFIFKQLMFPVIFTDENQLKNDLIHKVNTSSIFVLYTSYSNNKLISDYKKISKELRNETSLFLVINSSKDSLIVYREYSVYNKFEGDFNIDNMKKFILDNKFTVLPQLDGYLFDELEENNVTYGLIFINNYTEHEYMVNMSKTFPDELKYFYSIYDMNSYIVQYMGVPKNYLPTITILNSKMKVWKHFERKIVSATEFKSFYNALMEKRIKFDGPGSKKLGFLYSGYYTFRTMSPTIIYVTYGLIGFCILFIMYMLYDLYTFELQYKKHD